MKSLYPFLLSRGPGLFVSGLGIVLLLSGAFIPIPLSEASAASVHQPSADTPSQKTEVAVVRINSRIYTAEVARTAQDKMRGLMDRRSLPKDAGMLFLFEKEDFQSFWMKNTLIPLDVIFITKNKRIDSFVTMHPCPRDPCPLYASGGRIVYALEVNAGEVSKNGFKIGDKVEIVFK